MNLSNIENELDPSEQQIMSTIQGFLKNMPGHSSSSSQINKKVLDFDYSDDEDGGGGADFSEPTPQMIEALNSILNNEKLLTKLKNAGEITNNHIQQLQQLLPQHQPQHINQQHNFWGHQNMPSHHPPEHSSIWSNNSQGIQFHEKSMNQNQQNINSNSMMMNQHQNEQDNDEIQIVDDRNRDRSSRRSRSPRGSDRKRSRSHRSRSRSRDRSGRSSRRRSRSRERDMDREKRREREKRGLPPVRKNHLSGKDIIFN